MSNSKVLQKFFAVPFGIWSVLFIVLPLFFVLWHGLTDESGAFSLENIKMVLQWEYLKALGLSVELALVSTLICLILAYPLCLILQGLRKAKGIMIFLLFLLPLWMNSLLTTMAWQTILEKNGILNEILRFCGLPDLTLINTPAAIIRWGTRSDQTTIVTTLGSAAYEAARQGITPPAIFLVGDVVRCRGRLRWFDKRPLFGLTVGITRTRRQASALSARLEELGASCIEIPTIRLEDPSDHYATLDQAIYHLTSYDWLLFTSSNGVHRFFRRLREFKEDSRALGGLRLGVIGSATAEALRSYGLQADIVPPEYRAESLADSLLPHISPSSRVLLVRAEQARNVLPDHLRGAGARVTIAPAYRTVPASENRERLVSLLEEHALDLITCTSSSTVTSLLDLLGDRRDLLEPVPLACIGPVTAAACTREGLTPALTASTYTIEGLTQNILDWRRHHHEI